MGKIEKVLAGIGDVDKEMMAKAGERLDFLTKPQGSLGRLEELAQLVAGITGDEAPCLKHKVIFTLAADHGVAEEGVSAFPPEVTAQMVYNFLSGGAGINVLSDYVRARVVVVDMGVKEDSGQRAEDGRQKAEKNFKNRKIASGTKNMAKGPAMTKEQAIRSIEAGIELVEEELVNGLDIVGTGEMGIANTTAASAVACAITGGSARELTGRGTGISDDVYGRKLGVIEQTLSLNKPDGQDGLDVLSKVGGFEIGGLCGVILAAARHRRPVVIDGFISTAAALLACSLQPKASQYMIAAHRSVEPGHKIVLDYLGLRPLLDLDMRLGEGTGAALAMGLVEAGVRIMLRMASFKDAGVARGS